MDEEKEAQSLREEEYKDFKENAELKAIIAGQKAKKLTIRFGDIEIHFRAAIPKGIRDQTIKVAKDYQNGEIESADDSMYLIMSQLALEAPYTNPAAWKFIDEETGEVPNMLSAVMERISNSEVAAKRFR